MEMRKLLGLDPGTRNLGYCLVCISGGKATIEKTGTLGITGKADLQSALALSRQAFAEIATLPDAVGIESIQWFGKRKGVLILAHLAGMLGGMWASSPAGVWYFSPKEVKPESALHPRVGWTAHEIDALSLCRLVARKLGYGPNDKPVVAHPKTTTKRRR